MQLVHDLIVIHFHRVMDRFLHFDPQELVFHQQIVSSTNVASFATLPKFFDSFHLVNDKNNGQNIGNGSNRCIN